MVSKQEQENKLVLIPKTEKYVEYMLDIMIKLPRTEKFSIGTEYKQSMYKIINKIMLLNKIKNLNKQDENSYKIETIKILNEIDAELDTQRMYLRIMDKYKWIDKKKMCIRDRLVTN